MHFMCHSVSVAKIRALTAGLVVDLLNHESIMSES
jgi:hypothetical protein